MSNDDWGEIEWSTAPRPKDPERVRLGRMGARVLHASGKTNTAAAFAAWKVKVVADSGLTDEREAMRARMSELAKSRWAKRRDR